MEGGIMENLEKVEKEIYEKRRNVRYDLRGKLQVEIEQNYNREILSIKMTSSRKISNSSVGEW